MIENGERLIASKKGVQTWLDKVADKYPNITFCAYNANFDKKALKLTGLNVDFCINTLCLWDASAHLFCKSKRYIFWCMQDHRRHFSGKVIIKTSCVIVYNYLFHETGAHRKEPHTASEDLEFELKILGRILAYKKKLTNIPKYSWMQFTIQKCYERLI